MPPFRNSLLLRPNTRSLTSPTIAIASTYTYFQNQVLRYQCSQLKVNFPFRALAKSRSANFNPKAPIFFSPLEKTRDDNLQIRPINDKTLPANNFQQHLQHQVLQFQLQTPYEKTSSCSGSRSHLHCQLALRSEKQHQDQYS